MLNFSIFELENGIYVLSVLRAGKFAHSPHSYAVSFDYCLGNTID